MHIIHKAMGGSRHIFYKRPLLKWFGLICLVLVVRWFVQQRYVEEVSRLPQLERGASEETEDIATTIDESFRDTCSKSRLLRYERQCDVIRQRPPPDPSHEPDHYRGIATADQLRNLSIEDLNVVVGNLVVDDRHGVLYCSIPKAGCTTWKHYLWQNLHKDSYDHTGFANKIHNSEFAAHIGLPFLKTFNRTEIFRRLDTYFKLMVVRHPLDRFVSVYLEKFRGHKTYYKVRAGVRILKEFRRNPTSHELTNGDDVTFDEFIRYIVLHQRTRPLLDWHWENYQKLCFPCAIHYDYIAKLETNLQDSKHVVNKYLEGERYDEKRIRNQNRNVAPKSIWGNGKALELYSNISDDVYKDLLEFYQDDLEMFGYEAARETDATVVKCSGGDDCC